MGRNRRAPGRSASPVLPHQVSSSGRESVPGQPAGTSSRGGRLWSAGGDAALGGQKLRQLLGLPGTEGKFW